MRIHVCLTSSAAVRSPLLASVRDTCPATLHPAAKGVSAAFILLMSACQAEPAAELAQLRNPTDSWYGSDTPGWEVSGTPVFSVSEVAVAGEPVFLHDIQRAVFDRSGNILVVLRNAEQHIVVLDTTGNAQWQAGRTGDGPGEFREVSDILTVDGGILAWDAPARRLSRFVDSTFRETVLFDTRRLNNVIGVVSDSLLVAVQGIISSNPGTVREYYVWSTSGEVVDTVAGLTEAQGNLATLRVTYDGGGNTTRTSLPDCIAGTFESIAGNRVYIANAGRSPGQVFALDPLTGVTEPIYKTAVSPTISVALVDQIDAIFDGIEASARQPQIGPGGAETVRSNVRLVPDSVNAIFGRLGSVGEPLESTWSAMVTDEASEHLWLRRAECGAESLQSWEVISTSGELIAHVDLPAAMQLQDVRYPRMLVTQVDSLGVKRLEMLLINGGH